MSKHYLYDGTVEVDFHDSNHRYLVNGEAKTGVTTLLGIIAKQGLMLWPLNEAMTLLEGSLADFATMSTLQLKDLLERARKAHTLKSDTGKDVGKLTHTYIESYLAGQGPSVPQEAATPIRGFHKWLDEVQPQIVESERVVYSKQFDYAGTLDCLALIDGELHLIDFKTSNPSQTAKDGIYSEHYLQLGGYDLAYTEEVEQDKPRHHTIVNFNKKTGTFTMRTRDNIGLHTRGFLNALGLYRGLQEITREVKYGTLDRQAYTGGTPRTLSDPG